MGCWNGTCGISQMAILSGEPTIGFLMLRNHPDGWAANGHCYSTQYWCPLSLPIEGIYNDYGTLEDVDETNWNYKLATDYIKDNVIEKGVGDNKYHDITVSKDDLDWDKIADAMHEDRLELKTGGFWVKYYPHVTGLPVGFMMVHKRVFDAIIEKGIEGWWGKATMETLMKDGEDIIAYFRKQNKEYEDAVSKEDLAVARLMQRLNLEMICDNDRNNHLKNITISVEGAGFNTGKEYMGYLSEKISEGYTDEQLKPIIKKMAEFYIFQYAMSMLRKTWMPQAGAGGQSDEMEMYTTVNQAVDGIIAERQAECAAEDARWNEDGSARDSNEE